MTDIVMAKKSHSQSPSSVDSLVTVSLSSDGHDDDHAHSISTSPPSSPTPRSSLRSRNSDQTISLHSRHQSHPVRVSSLDIMTNQIEQLDLDSNTPKIPHTPTQEPSQTVGESPSPGVSAIPDRPVTVNVAQIASLVARLEEENARLASDPKANKKTNSGSLISDHDQATSQAASQPSSPSLRQIGRLVHPHLPAGTRVSLLPERPLTELEFWSFLVRDFHSVSASLPSLTASKFKVGVPSPLRGLVWASVAGVGVGSPIATELGRAWESLLGKETPLGDTISKDVGRCFPTVDLFRHSAGPGQTMLNNVLSAYSLHDPETGYCQGLGFVAGALLMQMGECEAFAVLVRLMSHYNLRPFYKPDLAGVYLTVFQFHSLLRTHNPTLANHFSLLQIDGSFLIQWFLSLFAATCPLPILFRIYDLLLFEGDAKSVILRVALSIVRQNEKRLLASTEYDTAMQFLLSPRVWDIYEPASASRSESPSQLSVPTPTTLLSSHAADALIRDVLSLADAATGTVLSDLEFAFADLPPQQPGTSMFFLLPTRQRSPSSPSSASRFLSRLWTSGASPSPPVTQSDSTLNVTGLSSPASSSSESLSSDPSSVPSTASANTLSSSTPKVVIVPDLDSRSSSSTAYSSKPGSITASGASSINSSIRVDHKDRFLHDQIESLMTALRHLQHEHSSLTDQLHKDREDRDRDIMALHTLVHSVHAHLNADTRLDFKSKADLVEGLGFQYPTKPSNKSSPLSSTRRSVAFVHNSQSSHSRSRSISAIDAPPSLHTALSHAAERLKRLDGSSSSSISTTSSAPSSPISSSVPSFPSTNSSHRTIQLPSVQVLRSALEVVSARAATTADILAVRDGQIIRLTDLLAEQTIESERLRSHARTAGDRSRDWDRILEELRDVRSERDRLAAAVTASSPPMKGRGKSIKTSAPTGLKQLRLGEIHSQQVTPPRSPPPPPHIIYSPHSTTLTRTNTASSLSSISSIPSQLRISSSSLSSQLRGRDNHTRAPNAVTMRPASGSPPLPILPSSPPSALSSSSSAQKTNTQLQCDLENVLMELAKAKTAEASAIQDLDEMRARFNIQRGSTVTKQTGRGGASSTPSITSISSSALSRSAGHGGSGSISMLSNASPSTGYHQPNASVGLGLSSSTSGIAGTAGRMGPGSHEVSSTPAVAATSAFGGLFSGWRKATPTIVARGPPAM